MKAASKPGTYCIGVDNDQWETIPEARPCLVSSAMKMINPGVFDLIKGAKEGHFPGGNLIGPVGLAPFHDFDSQIPQVTKDKLPDIAAALANGTINTGVESPY
jgi:basic membrane protein A